MPALHSFKIFFFSSSLLFFSFWTQVKRSGKSPLYNWSIFTGQHCLFWWNEAVSLFISYIDLTALMGHRHCIFYFVAFILIVSEDNFRLLSQWLYFVSNMAIYSVVVEFMQLMALLYVCHRLLSLISVNNTAYRKWHCVSLNSRIRQLAFSSMSVATNINYDNFGGDVIRSICENIIPLFGNGKKIFYKTRKLGKVLDGCGCILYYILIFLGYLLDQKRFLLFKQQIIFKVIFL